ncbi:MAG: diaminopimelate decarboxylase [Alphaproteobacteria bacterium]
MSCFCYRNGQLWAENVPVTRIAEHAGTPTYVYAAEGLRAQYRTLATALSSLPTTICYALKSNSNLAVIRIFAKLGAGADVVSEGELRRALAAGIPPNKIVFAGVGKTKSEMAAALTARVLQFNIESEPELIALSEVAGTMGLTAPVALRINPDVDAGTHDKISTGRKGDKFGIDIAQALHVSQLATKLPGISLEGMAVHIGSQLTRLDPYRTAYARLAELVMALRQNGIPIQRLDLGGGLGVPYRNEVLPSPADYATMVRETVGQLECDLVIEPGRYFVAEAGILLTKVIYIKEGTSRRFAIVDAAMNDLLRPSLYGAYHPILPVNEAEPYTPLSPIDIVGPVCESADILATQYSLPPIAAGDLLAISMAGAYGAVMASTYNSRPLVPETLVDGNKMAIIRPRPSLEALLAADHIPTWLN